MPKPLIRDVYFKWQNEKAPRFLQSQAKICMFVGGVRSSKTYTGAIKGVLLSLAVKNCAGIAIAPTFPMVREVLIDAYLKVLRFLSLREGKHYQYNKSEHRITFLNGAQILFRSANNPYSLEGLTADWFHIDEAAQINKNAYNTAIDRVSKAEHLGRGQGWLTLTPKGQNWVFEESLNAQVDKSYSLETILTREAGLVAQEDIEWARRNLEPRYFRQQYEATFENWVGLVYDDFSAEKNIKQCEFNPALPVYVGLDFGWNDPAVAVWMQYDRITGDWFVIGEFSRSHLSPETFAKVLRGEVVEFPNLTFQAPCSDKFVEKYIAGHEANISRQEADGLSIKRILGRFGINVESKQHKVFQRIQSTRAKILNADGDAHLFFSPKCIGLQRDLQAYHYPEKNGEVYGELPDEKPENHQYSHRPDALSYVIDSITPLREVYEWGGLDRRAS